MITSLYARLIVLTILAARHAPHPLSLSLDSLAVNMIAASRHLPPMPRNKARLGAPYIGRVSCPSCTETTPVIFVEGADLPADPIEKVTLDCPSCDGIEAYIL